MHTIDEHHSLFCAPLPPPTTAGQHTQTAVAEAHSKGIASNGAKASSVEARRVRQQERWAAERPLSEADLPAEERAKAARSTLPLALAKALHRHAIKSDPPRDTYIDPDSARAHTHSPVSTPRGWPLIAIHYSLARQRDVQRTSRMRRRVRMLLTRARRALESRVCGHSRIFGLHASIPQAPPMLRQRLPALPVGPRQRAGQQGEESRRQRRSRVVTHD